jgi:hypothetical protein
MEKEIDLKVKARFDGRYCGDKNGNRFCRFFDQYSPIRCVLFDTGIEILNYRFLRCDKCIEKFGEVPRVINFQIIGAEKLIEKLTKITKEKNSVWIDAGTGLPEDNQFLDLSEIDLKVKARFDGKFCGCDTKKISCQFHFRLDPGIHCVLHNSALAREPHTANKMGRTFRCNECIKKFGLKKDLIQMDLDRLIKNRDKLTASRWIRGSILFLENHRTIRDSIISECETIYSNGKQTFIFEIQEEKCTKN